MPPHALCRNSPLTVKDLHIYCALKETLAVCSGTNKALGTNKQQNKEERKRCEGMVSRTEKGRKTWLCGGLVSPPETKPGDVEKSWVVWGRNRKEVSGGGGRIPEKKGWRWYVSVFRCPGRRKGKREKKKIGWKKTGKRLMVFVLSFICVERVGGGKGEPRGKGLFKS